MKSKKVRTYPTDVINNLKKLNDVKLEKFSQNGNKFSKKLLEHWYSDKNNELNKLFE